MHKLLVVDDQLENRTIISEALGDIPIEIHQAEDGYQALDLVEKHHYFAILLDIFMPGMNGFDCAEKLSKDKRFSQIPIIFVTASDKSDDYILKSYGLGAVDFISKPIDPYILESKIRVFLNLQTKVSDEKSVICDLREEKNKQELMLNYIADGVIGFDKNNIITYANLAACTLLTAPADEILGNNIKDYVSPQSEAEEWAQSDFVQTYRDGQCNHCDDTYFWRQKTHKFPVQYTQSSIYSDNSIVGGMLVFQDISERKEMEKRLLKIAKYDELTGLANRSLYWEFLQKSIELAKRAEENLYILFLDLDRFKDVNDSLGHDAGDLLLIHVSERLRSTLRSADLISRLGGDEFAIIIQKTESDQAVAQICKKILSTFEKSFEIYGHEAYLGCSIGIARFPTDGEDASCITKSADTAMYSAKASGKNNFKFFQMEMHKKVESQLRLATELRVALTKDEIVPFFQTQVDIKEGRYIGAEALARWISGDESISPGVFIPVAEETGLISSVTQEILQAVGRTSREIDRMLPGVHFRVAVNISSKQVQESNFSRNLLNFFDQNSINPSRIEIEITESSLMNNSSKVVKELLTLRSNDIHISIDDFGTGYSSLAYLKSIPLDTIKIDQSFVKDIGKNKSDEKIIHAIIQLAHSLELKVVAEGVESQEQLNFLTDLDCDIIQGFLFSHPSPKDEFLRELALPFNQTMRRHIIGA